MVAQVSRQLAAAAFSMVWVLAGEVPDRQLRLLAVGESPPFRQVIRDGVRYELEPPAGSLPPLEVSVGGEADAGAGAAGKPKPPVMLALRLGRISNPVAVPAGQGNLDLRRGEGGEPGAQPWLRMARPRSGDFLVVLWRHAAGRDWRDVVGLTLADGPLGAPAGTVQIVNVFPQAVRILWGEESLLLPSTKSIQRAVKPGLPIPLQILVADPTGTARRYYSAAVTHNPGERGFIIIYRADGVDPRRPLKVTTLREPAPAVGRD